MFLRHGTLGGTANMWGARRDEKARPCCLTTRAGGRFVWACMGEPVMKGGRLEKGKQRKSCDEKGQG